ncbi:hypothetical protein EYF80_015440 [Liparis tanakae]|uniref:Uncharacterized protein n=1 Tax=Liparis tanakae TaxID=230148 RepID=A0A4Z2I8Q1_9TELE|nr:hypothetical protein EYF80_015440 [Liparis tanakae]
MTDGGHCQGSSLKNHEVPEISNTGTSNGEEMKDPVEISGEPDSILTDSIQSKACPASNEKRRTSSPEGPPPSGNLTNGQRPHRGFAIKGLSAPQSRTSSSSTLPKVTLHDLDMHYCA